LGLSFYKHLTPDGVGQPLLFIPMDQWFESGSRRRLLSYQILLKKQGVVGLLRRIKVATYRYVSEILTETIDPRTHTNQHENVVSVISWDSVDRNCFLHLGAA
jgi:hypothetical protein